MLDAVLRGSLRVYFGGALVERACLVMEDGGIIPIENARGGGEDAGLFDMREEDFVFVSELVFAGKVKAWCHNHPFWPALPSRRDILMHKFPIWMLIYSNSEDDFGEFSPEEIGEMEEEKYEI